MNGANVTMSIVLPALDNQSTKSLATLFPVSFFTEVENTNAAILK